ncbi:heterokaryon incompatibility protein [Echria macrotheca]|uniref:Heterokaryon incompatibility protein n=1 Tax=Echria macrotheca TaxID=438768 RepID=A0AAJ0B5F4_9PEZI|nr:heterokaryon incompatibility protein [Echria macrotheca]
MDPLYCALDPTKNEIRLIRFLRDGRSPLNLRLETVSKSENTKYHCLSYVWGDPRPVYSVTLNGDPFLVPQNLGDALEAVQAHHDIDLLWVDALCINQKDEAEKVHQIQMMDRIYRDATAVFAWVGLEADSSGDVMNEISRVGAIVVASLFETPYPEGGKSALLAAMESGEHKLVLHMLSYIHFLVIPPTTGEPTIFHVRDEIGWAHPERRLPVSTWSSFYSRPYWKRIWILQELALARDVYLVCGKHKTRLHFLLALWKIVVIMVTVKANDDMSEWLVDILEAYVHEAPLLTFLAHSIDFAGIGILDIIDKTSNMNATVPQDRIFALLALVSDDDKREVDISYSKSFQEHLERLVRGTFLRVGLQLAPIGYCQWASSCPTWIAQHSPWRRLRSTCYERDSLFLTTQVEAFAEERRLTQEFMAGGVADITIPLNSNRPGILRLPCHVLGTVEDHCQLSPTTEESNQHEIILDRIVLLNRGVDRTFSRLATSSWLVAVYSLRLLTRFLSGRSDIKLSDLKSYRDDEKDAELSRQIHALTVFSGKRALDVSEDYYQAYEEQVLLGFLTLRLASESFLDTLDEQTETASFLDMIPLLAFYARCVEITCRGRSVFRTSNDHIGLGSELIQSGDLVLVLPGVDVPWIARPAGSDSFALICEAYVPGFMYGELFDREDLPTPKWFEFC